MGRQARGLINFRKLIMYQNYAERIKFTENDYLIGLKIIMSSSKLRILTAAQCCLLILEIRTDDIARAVYNKLTEEEKIKLGRKKWLYMLDSMFKKMREDNIILFKYIINLTVSMRLQKKSKIMIEDIFIRELKNSLKILNFGYLINEASVISFLVTRKTHEFLQGINVNLSKYEDRMMRNKKSVFCLILVFLFFHIINSDDINFQKRNFIIFICTITFFIYSHFRFKNDVINSCVNKKALKYTPFSNEEKFDIVFYTPSPGSSSGYMAAFQLNNNPDKYNDIYYDNEVKQEFPLQFYTKEKTRGLANLSIPQSISNNNLTFRNTSLWFPQADQILNYPRNPNIKKINTDLFSTLKNKYYFHFNQIALNQQHITAEQLSTYKKIFHGYNKSGPALVHPHRQTGIKRLRPKIHYGRVTIDGLTKENITLAYSVKKMKEIFRLLGSEVDVQLSSDGTRHILIDFFFHMDKGPGHNRT